MRIPNNLEISCKKSDSDNRKHTQAQNLINGVYGREEQEND